MLRVSSSLPDEPVDGAQTGGPGDAPFKSIAELLELQAAQLGDSNALLAMGSAPLTYSQLWRLTTDMIGALEGIDLGRCSRVAIMLPDGQDLAAAILAVGACATAVPISTAEPRDQLQAILAVCQGLVVQRDSAADEARQIAASLGLPILELPLPLEAGGRFRLKGGAGDKSWLAGPADDALLITTAGTTGAAKTLRLSQRHVCETAHLIGQSLQLSHADVCLNVMPLYHMHGIQMVLSSLMVGGSVVCLPGFSPAGFFDALAMFRPAWFSAVSAIHGAILASAPEHKQAILSNPLRLVRSGSDALSRSMLAELERVFQAPVVEGYLATDFGFISSTSLDPVERKPGSVGRVTHRQVSIIGPEGNPLQAGEVGEITVWVPEYGPRELGQTEDSTLPGWLGTGDLGFLDEDGYLSIVGRVKDVINRGGEKISPAQVDDVLLSHPAVAQAAAFGVPHPKLGEDVAAAVVIRSAGRVTERELRAFAAKRLARSRVPRRLIFVDSIPLTPIGKPARAELRRMHGDALKVERRPLSRTNRQLSPLEQQLASIWQRLLGLESVGLNEDFFELGGESIIALQLVDEINRLFGLRVPISSLFQGTTIADLARLLADAPISDRHSHLAPIQPAGTEPPLFCVHPSGGEVLCLARLGRSLGGSWPFFGLQAGDWLTNDRPFTIEDIARSYLAAVQTVDPRGPYYLSGYSVGGSIALEMAQQLIGQGYEVAFLGLLDHPCQDPSFHRFTWDKQCLAYTAQKFLAFAYAVWQTRADLRRGPLSGVVRVAKAWANSVLRARVFPVEERPYVANVPPEYHRRYQSFIRRFNSAIKRYKPQPYPGRITLFRALQQPLLGSYDPTMGWGNVAAAGLTIVVVPGDHIDMIAEPHVRVLGAKLRGCLEQSKVQ
jgi:acyl-CoA synthetase (AMP-forming)/AMP-acid ligase II/thioesterase domain-containing protein/acyl carrier protein